MSYFSYGQQFSNMWPRSSPAATAYHGLVNQGATCYLNSVLQVLFMTEDFREAVERFARENPKTECIDLQLASLFDDLKKRKAHTYGITKQLGIDRVYEQRDSAEYFAKILDLTSPEASKIFHGELTHKTICSSCDTVADAHGPFWHLSLALVDCDSKDFSVVDGINEYFRDSHFSGGNQIYCDTCDDKSDSTIKCVIKTHPEVLVLLLKRFDFSYRYMTYVKINCNVDVPRILQVPENQTYELYAVVEHFGDIRGGHYTATIKPCDDKRWYDFNDARVTLRDYQPLEVDDFEKSGSAYLLFYRKKNAHAADTCTRDFREASAPGGVPPATSEIYVDQREGGERREGEEVAQTGDQTEKTETFSEVTQHNDTGRPGYPWRRQEGLKQEVCNMHVCIDMKDEVVNVNRDEDEQLERRGQAGLSGSSRGTERWGDGRTEMSEPKERSGLDEEAMEGRRGSKQTKTYPGKINEEEFNARRRQEGLKQEVRNMDPQNVCVDMKDEAMYSNSSPTKHITIKAGEGSSQGSVKSLVEYNEGNVGRESDSKTDAKVSLLKGVCSLKLNDSPGNSNEDNETNVQTQPNARKMPNDAKHAGEKREKKKKRRLWRHPSPLKQNRKLNKKQACIWCFSRKRNADPNLESD